MQVSEFIDHFKSTKWTFDTMNALTLAEIKAHLQKAGVEKTNMSEAYTFFKRLKAAKHTKEGLDALKEDVNNVIKNK